MSKFVILHNPRCSKSRATLDILEQKHVEISVIKYMENRLNAAEIKQLLTKLNMGVRDILRKNETDYKDQSFADSNLSETELISKLSQFPKVMERPIVYHKSQAVIGRPPENVLSLFQ